MRQRACTGRARRAQRWMLMGATLIGMASVGRAVVWGSETESDGPVLAGMHSVGQAWVEGHGDYAEASLDPCRSCHGADLRGTAASRTAADRVLDADDFGRKFFWQGFQVGCFACHGGPTSERRAANSPAQVADASLTIEGEEVAAVHLDVVDADDDPTELRIISAPAHGSASIESGVALYVPEPGFFGEDEFTFAAWDGFIDSNLAHVFVSVVAGSATPEDCPGDCNSDGQIVVSELVTALHGVLRGEASTDCAAADTNGDGLVGIDELVAAVGAALRGCGAATAPPTPTATLLPVATPTRAAPSSFAVLQEEILSPSCAAAFCHSAQSGAGGLVLETGSAYAQLVGVPARNSAARASGLQLVVAGMPESSFLLIKLIGPTAEQGARMPVVAPLSAGQIEKVRSWIAAGALP